MAEKRMFAKSIVLTDAFLDMPMSARCLYFTLGMLADDDGFVGSPKSIMRQCGASQDDLGMLLAKRFVLGFESGVIVIKHWRINNYLQNDRYHPTTYQEELATLMLDKKGAYTEAENQLPESCIQESDDVYTECIQHVYAGKNSQDKNSKDQFSIGKSRQEAPSLDDIKKYAQETGSNVDPARFYQFYSGKDWMTGNEPINDWKALFRTWSAGEKPKKPKQYVTSAEYNSKPQKIDAAAVNKVAELIKSWGEKDCTTSE